MITNSKYFLEALHRMDNENRGFSFENKEGSFQMTLRPEKNECLENDNFMSFEIVIVYEEDKDPRGTFHALLEREFEEMDEDDYLMDDFSIEKNCTETSDDVRVAMEIVNQCFSYRFCPCNKYFIKGTTGTTGTTGTSYPMCYRCHMTATEDDMKVETCAICHEETPRIGMKPQSCCKQYMHARCINRWNDSNPTCPICRVSDKLISGERV